MANLQKIVKVTQTQYDTLASGGTVGDYTGLNDNYLYLIQSDSPDLPTIGSEDKNKVLHTNSSTGELEWSGNYVDLTSDQTITGNKTHTGTIYFPAIAYTYGIKANGYELVITINNYNRYRFGNVRFTPASSNTTDLGASSLAWKDLYLSGNLSDGTNSITVAEIVAKQDAVEVKRYI